MKKKLLLSIITLSAISCKKDPYIVSAFLKPLTGRYNVKETDWRYELETNGPPQTTQLSESTYPLSIIATGDSSILALGDTLYFYRDTLNVIRFYSAYGDPYNYVTMDFFKTNDSISIVNGVGGGRGAQFYNYYNGKKL